MLAYKNEHGDVNVPDRFDTGLGKWIRNQRTDFKKGVLSAKAIQRLSDIGLVWDIPELEWEEKFIELLAYKNKYGNLDVPQNVISLGEWVSTQRKNNKNGKLSDVKITRLNKIGFVWNSYDFRWAERFRELLVYKGEHGDVNVSSRHPGKLGLWVHTQRRDKKNGKLPADKIRQLDEIGFEWELKRASERSPDEA